MKRSLGSRVPLFKIKYEEKGTIQDIKEMIVRIDGLSSCLNGQIVTLGEGIKGIIMGFDEDHVLVLTLGDQGKLRLGQEVTGVSEPFKIPVGEHLLGRMVSALGDPCDHQGDIEADDHYPVLRDSVPLTGRAPMNEFFATGTKVVDMVTPLAKGQRQLILGDRMTGKTAIAVDAILNQKGKGIVCIYCCIGKSISGLEKVLSTLQRSNALDYTVIVAANDNAPVGEQYLVPFSAAAMGEYFVAKGQDVLVVFDDLTKHAWAYRQLSLLMDRPPGREAYPGDVFYVQTQLMERAGKFNEEYGSGSMTFLGIAETLQGDMTGYIPSNLVSMADGQISLSSAIFAEGRRPAVDLNLSLSIVGGRVQPKILRKLSRALTADHARHVEVLRLSRVSSGLSGESEQVVRKGEVIRSLLMQEEFMPVSVAESALILYTIEKGYLENRSEDQRKQFRTGIYGFVNKTDAQLLEAIETVADLTPEIEEGMRKAIAEFLAAQDQETEG